MRSAIGSPVGSPRIVAMTRTTGNRPNATTEQKSRRAEKVWPYFYDLGKALFELSGKRLVVAGNQKQGKYPDMLDLRGDLQLMELPDLINRAQVIVSNDSAPLHLASALGKPLVARVVVSAPTQAHHHCIQGRNDHYHLTAIARERIGVGGQIRPT